MTDQTPFPIRNYLAPHYWPVWLGLACGRLAAALPFRAQMGLGRLLGRLARRLMPRRRHIAATNLRLCFPELGAEERDRLLHGNFDSMGMGLVETAMCWWSSPQALEPLVELSGLEHLEAALARGKGVILLSAHFTTLELGGRLLALHTPFHVMYRTHKNPLFETVMRRSREAHFEKAIPRDDLRGMLRSLKQNLPVWYAPDQNYGREHSEFVPFFGIQASTITATARIARISNAAVVPFFPLRRDDNQGYRLELLPALEGFPSGDDIADTRRINELLEERIRTAPEQYLWAHRRFKTRPEGVADHYAR